jgi:hypothetical protein
MKKAPALKARFTSGARSQSEITAPQSQRAIRHGADGDKTGTRTGSRFQRYWVFLFYEPWGAAPGSQ